MPNLQTLNVFSIFRSINGEVNAAGQGSWATFIRLAGCNLNCAWCDTEYAQSFDSGKAMSIPEVMEKVEELHCSNVTVTGGEPLAQRGALTSLLKELIKQRFNVSIETNGSYPIIPDMKVSWVVDYKLPSSNEISRMNVMDYWWYQLTPNDFIKFVISNQNDYHLALTVMNNFWQGGVQAQMVFSPLVEDDSTAFFNTLYGWMQDNQLFSVILNFQIHKIISLEEPA